MDVALVWAVTATMDFRAKENFKGEEEVLVEVGQVI